jgi:Phage integrase family
VSPILGMPIDRSVELGQPVRYLFLQHGRLASSDYLFARALDKACTAIGLMTSDGKGRINPHRFRHTLGTELGEKGARLQTIMKMLGHQSAGMSMTYVNMTDPTVLADYASVLTPGAIVAGPQATAIRGGELGEEAVNWLKPISSRPSSSSADASDCQRKDPANATST